MSNIHHIPYAVRTVEPAEEPVSLAEAKLYLRVDGADEDSLISRMIAAARLSAEQYMRTSLVTQSWKLIYDDYAPSCFELPYGPVQSVSSIVLVARDSSQTTVNSGNYYLSGNKQFLVVDTALIAHRVETTYVAGFGDAVDVPAAIKQGMMVHIAKLYEQRPEPVQIGEATRALYDIYRQVRL